MSPSTSEVRVARADFSAGAATAAQLPPPRAPEVAFAGRSNVGKSSLLNMLLGRRNLARTSSTPGCTRQVNFFDVALAGGPELVFVDLPGYGYAKVAKSEARSWKILLEAYLRERPTLRAVAVLVDARRGLEEEEHALLEFLATRPDLDVFVVATKTDKLPRSRAKVTLRELAAAGGVEVIGTSAETALGREAVWDRILRSCTLPAIE